ncbi:MAG: trypsin-like peptidase domain-containing protein [Planctomycetota bacterium]
MMRRFLVSVTFVSCIALTQSAGAEQEVLQLEGGRSITGEVIKENDKDLFVDLGYSVVPVPRRSVLSRSPLKRAGDASQIHTCGAHPDVVHQGPGTCPTCQVALIPLNEASEPVAERLYRIGGAEPVAVNEAVKKLGGGVVKVRCAGGQGSGFIIDKRGHVVTNFHVVENERDVEIDLYMDSDTGLQKKRVKDVEIVALNEFLDLALLRIPNAESLDLKPISLADRNSIKVGESVYAIGAPLGMERTVTEGIISDPYRSFEGNCYIQTDVAINPGNSGGPLFNSRGEIIGVTNMGFRGMEGLNFAIPIDAVTAFIDRRSSFLFDESRPNSGVHYFSPPRKRRPSE